ncbi:hypothetical protein MTO98_09065 [Mucilaginibacter sp. SMC90]|nr:hypothetical protein [Mucilaginibacter sp. SMC90]UOE51226.1 hypothetical protein MTO98_09065 [Mucilaginibacter sp. SMC90]
MKKTYNSVSLLLNYKSKVMMNGDFNNHVSVNWEIVWMNRMRDVYL